MLYMRIGSRRPSVCEVGGNRTFPVVVSLGMSCYAQTHILCRDHLRPLPGPLIIKIY